MWKNGKLKERFRRPGSGIGVRGVSLNPWAFSHICGHELALLLLLSDMILSPIGQIDTLWYPCAGKVRPTWPLQMVANFVQSLVC